MRGGLAVWAVGAQVNEGIASLGAIATLIGALGDASKVLPRREGPVPWAPLVYLLSWGLLWSSVFRWQLPTGFGAVRLFGHDVATQRSQAAGRERPPPNQPALQKA